LCGADPHKFAELRELALINEQISWKQRFFIPTDETTGVQILSALLDRYPVVIAEEAGNEIQAEIIEAAPQMSTMKIVDLDQWIVAAGKAIADETAHEVSSKLEGELAFEAGADEVPSDGVGRGSNLYSYSATRSRALAWAGDQRNSASF
jgi:hypothetical protein